jgi:CBS domain-containing protein
MEHSIIAARPLSAALTMKWRTSNPMSDPDDSEKTLPLKTLAAEKTGALRPEDSVQIAGDRMRARDAATWPVAKNRKLVGMVDEKHPDRQLGREGHDPTSWTVGQIMSRDLVFCYEDEECERAQKLMEERDLRYLPVVDREMRIVGIFSRAEIQEKVDQEKSEPSPPDIRPAFEA